MTDPSYDLAARMAELGAPNPDAWARSELSGGIPQEARWLLVRLLWRRCISEITVDGNQHAKALAESGVDSGKLQDALRLAAFEAVFGALDVLDNGQDLTAPATAPGWQLVETRYFDEEATQTGRVVAGLGEDIRDAAPSGEDSFIPW